MFHIFLNFWEFLSLMFIRVVFIKNMCMHHFKTKIFINPRNNIVAVTEVLLQHSLLLTKVINFVGDTFATCSFL